MVVYRSWFEAQPTRASIVAIRTPIRRVREPEKIYFGSIHSPTTSETLPTNPDLSNNGSGVLVAAKCTSSADNNPIRVLQTRREIHQLTPYLLIPRSKLKERRRSRRPKSA